MIGVVTTGVVTFGVTRGRRVQLAIARTRIAIGCSRLRRLTTGPARRRLLVLLEHAGNLPCHLAPRADQRRGQLTKLAKQLALTTRLRKVNRPSTVNSRHRLKW
jgi:hypothetical protein